MHANLLIMIHRFFFSVIVTGLVFLVSCSTDVDNYADYKDVTVVYGLLEAGKDTTFIKINKAFLGPGNALLFAQIPDSNNYPGKLNARLLGKRGNLDLPPIILDTITRRNKLAGDSVFYFPAQKLYFTTTPIDANASYRLSIERPGGLVTSTTEVVRDFPITQPISRINFAALAPGTIRWNSAQFGKRYEVTLVFHYEEIVPGNPDTLKKQMVWALGSRKAERLSGGDQLEISYIGEEFYNRLGGQLANILNVKRFAGEVDVIISSGGDELSTYLDVNAPNNSIVQERPEYTNIENGIGLFSSRRTIVRPYRLSTQSEIKLVENFNWGFEIKPF